MSRTQIVIESVDNQRTAQIIDNILDSHGYEYVQKGNEAYWQQGIGVTQSPKFVGYFFNENTVVIEGWVKNFGSESDLSGFVGAVPKKSVKKVLDEIQQALEQSNQMPANNVQDDVDIIVPKQATVEEASMTDAAFNNLEGNQNEAVSDNVDTSPSVEDNVATTSAGANLATSPSVDGDVNALAFQKLRQNYTGGVNNIPNTSFAPNNAQNRRSSGSKGIIPRKYRGSVFWNIIEIFIALFWIYGASTGYMVLRFTDSSEALILVAIIVLAHGGLSLISHMMDK